MGQFILKIGATLAVAGSLVVAGCGDDEAPAPIAPIDSGATGPTGNAGPITPEELIDEGDPICAEAYTALASAPANIPGSQQAAIVEGLIEGLQSLGDPGTENAADLDAFYDGLEDAQKDYDNDDTASAEAALAEARAAASDYGFKNCGEEGEALDGAGTGTSGSTSGGSTSTEPVAPTEPAPTEPEPVTPAPPAGGTGTDDGTVPPTDGGGTGGGDTGGTGGNSGGVSP